jgi:enoyl-[acyl-carrier protein] reductase II
LVLIPSIRARVDLPIIAASGFGNGQGLAAALSLGADAVAMGTRFACTQESPLHENVKRAIAQESMTESDTIYSKHFDGIWARVMKTPTTVEAAKRVRACVRACMRACVREFWVTDWGVARFYIIAIQIVRESRIFVPCFFSPFTDHTHATHSR